MSSARRFKCRELVRRTIYRPESADQLDRRLTLLQAGDIRRAQRLLSLGSSVHESTYLVRISSICDHYRAIAQGSLLIAKRSLCPPSVLARDPSSATDVITDLGCTSTDYVNDCRQQDSASGAAAGALGVPACVVRVTTKLAGTCVQQCAYKESSGLTVIDFVISACHAACTPC